MYTAIICLFAVTISMVSCDSIANPFVAPTGLGTMHGDTMASDTTLYSGPGTARITYNPISLLSVCPTVVQGNDGFILALCTTIFARRPIVYMVRMDVAIWVTHFED